METLKTFLEIADVFLINEVDSDAAETHVLSTLKANGLVKEVKGNVDGSSPSSAIGEGIPEHVSSKAIYLRGQQKSTMQ